MITLLAALAVLYPVSTATRTPAPNAAPATELSKGKAGASASEQGSPDFPTARDLVSEFYLNDEGTQSSSGHSPEPGYTIDFLIATVPDPVSSRLPHFFDSFVEFLESAVEASGYTLDRFALPWLEKGDAAHEDIHSWHRTLYESAPGLILFRNPQDRKLLLIFLVGETPTTGIHKAAMISALNQMAQFYPWDAKHLELPSGFPQVSQPPDAVRIMGPSFSGSAVSLRFALDRWGESRGSIPGLRFQIISGTATAIESAWLSQAAQGRATFQATVPPDVETLQAVACYIGSLGYPKIAILTESNTAYGQNATHQGAAGKVASGEKQAGCADGGDVPEMLSLPFPMEISRLRIAANSVTPQSPPADSGSGNPAPVLRHLSQKGGTESREVIPSF
jgi:hypothetical protein